MMLAQHAPSHPPSPSFSYWSVDKENAHPTHPSSRPTRNVLGSSSASTSSAHLSRRKSPSFSTSSPYDRPSYPSTSSGQPKRRIKSVTNVTGPSTKSRGLRIPSLQAVADKVEKEAPLVEGKATTVDGPVVFDKGSAFLPLSLPRPNRMAVINVYAVEELEGIVRSLFLPSSLGCLKTDMPDLPPALPLRHGPTDGARTITPSELARRTT